MKDLQLHKRLLKLLYDHNEEHVGSCFSCVDIIDQIFKNKSKNDIFILSNGHAAYALYCVLEKYYDHVDADELVRKHGGHPNLDKKNHIYCSTGSLGMGIMIGTGRAVADPSKTVHIMISDGESTEGSVWEALRYIEEKNVNNVEVYVNANGYACYDEMNVDYLERRCKAFLPRINFYRTDMETCPFPFLVGIDAHYIKINDEQYRRAMEILNNEN
jgi:transketolase N-terminal domain/subunit